MAGTDFTKQVDEIFKKYELLQNEFGLPLEAAIFDSLKSIQKQDGTFIPEGEEYIEKKLNIPVTQQRRLRSFYDLLSKDIEGGASGHASETLFKRFLGNDFLGKGGEAQEIREAGMLLQNYGPESHTFKNYVEKGGYEALKKAFKMSNDDVLNEVEKSNLRGRGGAYFPSGIKFKDAAARVAEHKFLVCNADEGEPPTCKDKVLMEYKPHLLIEGMVIAGKAIGANLGIIYIRGDYERTIAILSKAIEEARKEGYLGDNILGSGFKFEIIVFRGSGSYVAGASGAMVDSIEGKIAVPRTKLYRLTQSGINGLPTVVSNVESLSNIPYIVINGGEAFSKIGSPTCPGTKIFNLCGDVNRPGIYELPTGIKLSELIEKYGQGVKGGKLKAVSPGGATTALLSADEADVKMDPESLAEKRTSFGSGAVAVFNDKRSMREFSQQVLEFLGEESCGKCMQCPIIINSSLSSVKKLKDTKSVDVEIESIMTTAKKGTRPLNCELGKGSHNVVVSAIKKFPKDFGIK